MIFSFLIFLFFALAIPLWIYRGWVFLQLPPRARAIFKRLESYKERAWVFALKMFLVLLAVSGVVMSLVYGLGFLKSGSARTVSSYKDVVRNRLYTGTEEIDPYLNTYVYEMPLVLVAVAHCLLLAISFTLVAKALNDISLIRRLKERLRRVSQSSA